MLDFWRENCLKFEPFFWLLNDNHLTRTAIVRITFIYNICCGQQFFFYFYFALNLTKFVLIVLNRRCSFRNKLVLCLIGGRLIIFHGLSELLVLLDFYSLLFTCHKFSFLLLYPTFFALIRLIIFHLAPSFSIFLTL